MKIYTKFISAILYALSTPIIAAQGFLDFEDGQVGYHTGAQVSYYGEYGAKAVKELRSFPLTRCDPVPIDPIGDVKVFFTSAIEGHQPMQGQGIVIPTPESLTRIVAVRGKAGSSGNRFEAYIGYNPAEFAVKGRNRTKIHRGVLLALQVKDTRHVENRTVQLFSDAQHLTNMIIGQQIQKLLKDPKDFNWNSPVFQKHFQDMLPQREGFFIAHQMIGMNIAYWTKEENRLKKTTYKGRKE
ncbi:MAG: hypothetical protein K2Y18_07190 [Alphaproteobacteria bacterium]|jgi:hypothetical protein|nr:hypothetical protein [Alphaproteobacteria bacterium]